MVGNMVVAGCQKVADWPFAIPSPENTTRKKEKENKKKKKRKLEMRGRRDVT